MCRCTHLQQGRDDTCRTAVGHDNEAFIMPVQDIVGMMPGVSLECSMLYLQLLAFCEAGA